MKVCLVGDSGVGKTALAHRMCKDRYDIQETTLGANFHSLEVCTESETVKLSLWDTAGQERYARLTSLYTHGAKVILFCIDSPIFSEFMLSLARHRIDELDSKIFLVITKSDINRSSFHDILEYANLAGYPVFKTSAKTGECVSELISAIAEEFVGFVMPETIILTESPAPASCCGQ